MTAHETLGVKPGATTEEIKKAYHKLAHQHHPDRGGDIKKMQEINQAYAEIKDGKISDAAAGYKAHDFTWDWRTPFYEAQQDDFLKKVWKIKVQNLISELKNFDHSHPDLNVRELVRKEFNL